MFRTHRVRLPRLILGVLRVDQPRLVPRQQHQGVPLRAGPRAAEECSRQLGGPRHVTSLPRQGRAVQVPPAQTRRVELDRRPALPEAPRRVRDVQVIASLTITQRNAFFNSIYWLCHFTRPEL